MSNHFHWLLTKILVLLASEAGQDLLEYALLAGMIVFGILFSVGSVGAAVATMFANIGASVIP